VQVAPIKPTLKAPGTKRLKLKCDEPLSNFAFNFKLRRYTMAPPSNVTDTLPGRGPASAPNDAAMSDAARQAGAYTRPLFGST